MAKYNGSIELISGVTQANGGDFALVHASAVQVDDDGKRLDVALSEIHGKINNITMSGIDIDEHELRAMLDEVFGSGNVQPSVADAAILSAGKLGQMILGKDD
jgi:hypothetical protein